MLELTSPLDVLAVMAEARCAPILFSDSMVIPDRVRSSASSHSKAELGRTTSYRIASSIYQSIASCSHLDFLFGPGEKVNGVEASFTCISSHTKAFQTCLTDLLASGACRSHSFVPLEHLLS